MKVLIVEDDKNKISQISQTLRPAFPNVAIECAYSYRSGLKAILDNNYDLIILDMSLPTYDVTDTESGFQFRPFGGREILSEMKRKRRNYTTLVLTQFETFGAAEDVTTLKELTRQLQRDFVGIFGGIIYYNASESNWKSELVTRIHILKATL